MRQQQCFVQQLFELHKLCQVQALLADELVAEMQLGDENHLDHAGAITGSAVSGTPRPPLAWDDAQHQVSSAQLPGPRSGAFHSLKAPRHQPQPCQAPSGLKPCPPSTSPRVPPSSCPGDPAPGATAAVSPAQAPPAVVPPLPSSGPHQCSGRSIAHDITRHLINIPSSLRARVSGSTSQRSVDPCRTQYGSGGCPGHDAPSLHSLPAGAPSSRPWLKPDQELPHLLRPLALKVELGHAHTVSAEGVGPLGGNLNPEPSMTVQQPVSAQPLPTPKPPLPQAPGVGAAAPAPQHPALPSPGLQALSSAPGGGTADAAPAASLPPQGGGGGTTYSDLLTAAAAMLQVGHALGPSV